MSGTAAVRAARLSVVVVVYDMVREFPRTLRSLGAGYQRAIEAADYEVIVVDNGSPEPLDPELLASHTGPVRLVRLDPAPPSPVRAANEGLALATGDVVGLLVDGARIASPGLLAGARRAMALADRPVITAPAWHLGPVPHMRAATAGYDQAVEDGLLESIGWPADGDRLFEISTLAGSSSRGLFGPKGESNSLFLPRALWDDLGGLDERFVMPGGGLANHDVFRRACELPGIELVELLGEGTFHQIHGGVATSRHVGWDDMHAEYVAIRGRRFSPPPNPILHVGTVPPAALVHVERSARTAQERLGLTPSTTSAS